MRTWMAVLFVLALSVSVHPALGQVEFAKPSEAAFNAYWYSDGAEISRYALKQSRYGELHTGDAILLYVTEKLRSHIQIKADDPTTADLPVLKLNAQRNFFTGVYPYTTMTSVFSPVADGARQQPVKISTSVQEWCGQVYMQMNLRGTMYEIESFSYFESEGDRDTSVPRGYSEDGLFNLVRLAPDQLPTGEFDLIVGTLYSRLMHRPLKAYSAVGEMHAVVGSSEKGTDLVAYTVNMESEQRTLTIVFERAFPHRIERWEDQYPSLPFAGSKMLTTTAVRTHTIKSKYWKRHGNADRALLDELGLEAR